MNRSSSEEHRTFFDLSIEAPLQDDSCLAEKLDSEVPGSSRAQPASNSTAQPLWGEMEDPDPAGPPRWRHVRRRTAPRAACLPEAPSCSDALRQPDMPPPSPWQMDSTRDWDSCLRDLAGPSSGPMPSNQHMHMPQLLPPAAARRYPAPPAPAEIPSAAVPPAAASRRELRSRPPLAPPSLPSPAMSGQRTLQDELNQRMHARAAAHASRAARSRASADADLTDHLHDLHALDMWAPPAEADVARPSWSGWRAAFNASEESSRTRGLSLTDVLGIFGDDDTFPPPTMTRLGGQHASTPGRGVSGAAAPHSSRARRTGSHASELRHLSALREAMMGAGSSNGGLPLHLLLSDRDFDENDYEALLALDDTVESRKGASAIEIGKIPTQVVMSGLGGSSGEVRCAICLEEYVSGAVQRCLACSHRFHCACIDQWLARKATCPICQRSCCT